MLSQDEKIQATESALTATTVQLQDKAQIIEAQNAQLRAVIERKRALVQRLQTSLQEAQSERQSIEKEVQRILRPAPRRARTSSSEVNR